MDNESYHRCARCCYDKATRCEHGTLSEVAQIGKHTIYNCAEGGVSFCLQSEDSDTGSAATSAVEIACTDLSFQHE